jgi:hypothetical protein
LSFPTMKLATEDTEDTEKKIPINPGSKNIEPRENKHRCGIHKTPFINFLHCILLVISRVQLASRTKRT